MNIVDWCTAATKRLNSADIPSARLDAELILAHTIRKPRTYLHARGEDVLEGRYEDIANARLELRLGNTPVAYIVGHKEFYRRRFKTTPAALIPRPESEDIISLLGDVLFKYLTSIDRRLRVVDVGTGTGCLGITAKLEWPELDVTLTDNSIHTLNLARENALALKANVHVFKNDLLAGYGPTDVILANLPYVDRSWQVSPDTNAEPPEALYAANHGLSLIYRLLDQAYPLLYPGGYILIESDLRQQAGIIKYAKSLGFHHVTTQGLITLFSCS